jgi:hypothetical protein
MKSQRREFSFEIGGRFQVTGRKMVVVNVHNLAPKKSARLQKQCPVLSPTGVPISERHNSGSKKD